MKTYSLSEFKDHFSEIIDKVRAGEEIFLSTGKEQEKFAVVPYVGYKAKKIQVGLLQDKTFKIHNDFIMSEEELLNL
jgi:prevent-host-death family protein